MLQEIHIILIIILFRKAVVLLVYCLKLHSYLYVQRLVSFWFGCTQFLKKGIPSISSMHDNH